MRSRKRFLTVLNLALIAMVLPVLGGSPDAQAGFGFQILGGLVRNSNVPPLASADAGTAVTPRFSDDTGTGLGFSLGSGAWKFEAVGVYLDRSISFTADNGLGADESDNVSVQTLYAPIQIRRLMGRFLSVSAGGYYEASLTKGYNSDIGLAAGARLRVPLKGKLGIFAEGSYQYGLVDFDGVTTRRSMVLFGLGWNDL